jgi:hypothetical protein
MADKIPVKAIYTGSDVTSLGEFTSTDKIPASYINGAPTDTLPLAGGTMTGTTAHGDSVKATFGDTGDLEIMHDGAHSNITESGTGDLRIRADNLRLSRSSDAELYMYCTTDAGVQIYHNGNEKLETTSTGIDVTGSVTCDELVVQGGITEQQVSKSASFTPVFTEGTVYSCTGTMTITMPTATAGKNFTVIHATATSITWAGTIKWNGGAAPTAGSGIDIYVFVSDGTNWYGMQSGTGFA